MDEPNSQRDFGIYTRVELADRDFTDTEIRRMVRTGALSHLARGWYATPTAEPAAATAVSKGGCLSCVSALAAYGFWVPPGYSGTTHIRGAKRRRGDLGFCRGYGPPLPVTAAVDLAPTALVYAARCMTAEDWIAVTDSVMNTWKIDVPALQEMMPYMPRTIIRLMQRCDHRSQSGTESIVRVRLRALGFAVEVQPRIEAVGHVDLKVGRLLIECDSKLHHTSLEDYQKDRMRDRKALIRQDIPFRVTFDDVIYGWAETLDDICAVTRPDRHRVRKGRSQ